MPPEPERSKILAALAEAFQLPVKFLTGEVIDGDPEAMRRFHNSHNAMFKGARRRARQLRTRIERIMRKEDRRWPR